jgi:hypothetical protein
VNWKFWKKKPEDVIPNPRDRRRHKEYFETAQRNTLLVLQFFVFATALLILLAVSQ